MDRPVKPGDDGGVGDENTRMWGDDIVCVGAVLKPSLESIEVSDFFPKPCKWQFKFFFCHS
jgi:hypothetical protein